MIKSENATINGHKIYGLWWSVLNLEGCTSLVKNVTVANEHQCAEAT